MLGHRQRRWANIDIVFTFLLGGIHAVKHNLNPCQPPYPIMHQSFALASQADVTRCIIVILFDQLNLEEGGVVRANLGGLPFQY